MKREVSIEEYNRWTRNMNILRWTVILTYLVLVTAISFIPLWLVMSEGMYILVYTAIFLGGLVLVFAIILLPTYKKGVRMPRVPDSDLVDGLIDASSLPPEVVQTQHMYVLYIVCGIVFASEIPFLIVWPTWETGAFIAGLGAFFLILCLLLGKLTVKADRTHLSFKFGPFGKKVHVDEIESIRSTSVHPLRDYMGYGFRMGPDGTQGYICSGKVGVRVELKNEKVYVITVDDPETLVRYVRAARRGAIV